MFVYHHLNHPWYMTIKLQIEIASKCYKKNVYIYLKTKWDDLCWWHTSFFLFLFFVFLHKVVTLPTLVHIRSILTNIRHCQTLTWSTLSCPLSKLWQIIFLSCNIYKWKLECCQMLMNCLTYILIASVCRIFYFFTEYY